MTENEFFFEGGRTGILLIHGLTGTPNEMRVLGKGLHRAGYSVYGVQLAGHCGTVEDLVNTTWQDWYQSVCEAADRLREHVDHFFVAGLSMGAVLALKLAADRPDQVEGVAALATMFRHDGWAMPFYSRFCFLLHIYKALGIGRNTSFIERPPYGIKDEMLRNHIVSQMHSGDSGAAGLAGNPWWALAEMYAMSKAVRQQLESIVTPCLIIHSKQDDIASMDYNARLIERSVKGPVETFWLEDSYHMITIDRERRAVTARVVEFIKHTLLAHQQAPMPLLEKVPA